MSKFIELDEVTGGSDILCFVNVEQIVRIISPDSSGNTTITFSNRAFMMVKKTPKQLLKMIKGDSHE